MDITTICTAVAGAIVTVLGAWYKINQSAKEKHADLDERYNKIIDALTKRVDQLEADHAECLETVKELRSRITELENVDK